MDIIHLVNDSASNPAICGAVGVCIALAICMCESYLRKPRKLTPVKPHPASIQWTKEYYASKGEPVPAHRIAQGYEQNDVAVVVAK